VNDRATDDGAGTPPAPPQSQTFVCPIRARTGGSVVQLVLEMPADFRFRAGQYLEILHPDGAIPLSIASGPHRLPHLHLHYRSTPGVVEAAWMDTLLAAGTPLLARGPFGNVSAPEDPDVPMLLIAGGTGISQVRALLDQFVIEPRRAPVTVLWCADAAADLYCRAELETMASARVRIESVVDPRRDPDNAGLRRAVELAVAAAAEAVKRHWILLGGSPGFVHAVADALTSAGIDPRSLHSDVFAYAPRAAGNPE
jgi:CDP-4-dehydro-6-deoxyglucose reductase